MTGHSGEGKGSDRTLREVKSDRTLRGGKRGVTGHSGEGKGSDRTLREVRSERTLKKERRSPWEVQRRRLQR